MIFIKTLWNEDHIKTFNEILNPGWCVVNITYVMASYGHDYLHLMHKRIKA